LQIENDKVLQGYDLHKSGPKTLIIMM